MLRLALAVILSCCSLSAREDIETLSQLDDYRRQINGAYLKAMNPIHRKGDGATTEEKSAFTDAAMDLVKMQKYMCQGYRKRLEIIPGKANRESNERELRRLHKVMKDANIRTCLPATHAELREAESFLNAFALAMRLPVEFSN